MRNINWKLIAATVFGAAALSTQAHAGWYGGDCAHYYGSENGTGVCVEYTDNTTAPNKWHIGSDNNVTTFKGPFVTPPTPVDGQYTHDTMENFRFIGQSNLSCLNGTVTASNCTLELDGKVKVDGTTVNIEVSDGSVTGSGLCGNITIDDFAWYIAPNDSHDAVDFGPNGGIPISGQPPYVGAVGPIGFTVKGPLGIVTLIDITDSHIHDVTFDNNGTSPSSFDFNNKIYENGTENDTGCSIDGTLYVADDNDIDIHFQ